MHLSSEDNSEIKKLSKKIEKNSITEDFIVEFLKRYNITYTPDHEELAINLALRGQEALSKNELEIAENIGHLLSELAKQWKDSFIKMKSHLLNAEIAGFKNEDKIFDLRKALTYAKNMVRLSMSLTRLQFVPNVENFTKLLLISIPIHWWHSLQRLFSTRQ